jgi:hypothetical protein
MVKLLKKMIITILVVLGVTVTTNASYSVVVTIPIESDTSSIIIEENGIKQEVTGNELRLEYDKVGNHEYTIYADGYNEKYSLSVFVGTNKDGVLYTEGVLTTDNKTKVDKITFKKTANDIEKPNNDEPKVDTKKSVDKIGTGVVDNPVMWGAIIALVLSLLYVARGDKKC